MNPTVSGFNRTTVDGKDLRGGYVLKWLSKPTPNSGRLRVRAERSEALRGAERLVAHHHEAGAAEDGAGIRQIEEDLSGSR